MAGLNNIGSGVAYDYGIDDKGKMYIWDKWGNKMIFYGSPKVGYNTIFELQVGHDAKTNFQGDKTNGGWADVGQKAQTPEVPSNVSVAGGGYAGGGGGAAASVLDQDQVDALQAQFDLFDDVRSKSRKKAEVQRDTSRQEKDTERGREKGKYDGKKLTTLQDFSGAKTDTDINTRNTLENLISSLSTMGLGGSRALTRQILDAANMSNRKANATQATNNQSLDGAWNEYEGGYKDDLDKISDQYDYDVEEANRKWAQDRQNNFYKIADVYNDADMTGERKQYMDRGSSLNQLIGDSVFVNPRYTGKARELATPELSDYTQDIATYNTTGVGAPGGTMTPVGGGTAPVAGNLAVRAMALNDADLGVKKKTEAELGYGV